MNGDRDPVIQLELLRPFCHNVPPQDWAPVYLPLDVTLHNFGLAQRLYSMEALSQYLGGLMSGMTRGALHGS